MFFSMRGGPLLRFGSRAQHVHQPVNSTRERRSTLPVMRKALLASMAAGVLVVAPAADLGSAQTVAYAASCERQDRSVIVSLDESRYPYTTDHTEDAIRAGEAALLHIDRFGADQNREESLRGIPTRSGYDRDEYPPAVSSEGGSGADVRYVPSGDNRGAGASMGSQLEGWCEDQPFRIKTVP